MPIVVGFDLPFAVHVAASSDDRMRLRVRCAPGATQEDRGRVMAHVAVFAEGALLGLGADQQVAPRWVDLSIDDVLVAHEGVPSVDSVTFEATHLVFGPRYVVVLLHKLLALHSITPIMELAIDIPNAAELARDLSVVRAPRSELPGVTGRLPFTLSDDWSSSATSLSVAIEFARAPRADDLEHLRHALRVWIAQALQGGYIDADVGPDNYFVNADDEVAVAGRVVEWSLENYRLDVGALNAIINMLAAYHDAFVTIREVLLE